MNGIESFFATTDAGTTTALEFGWGGHWSTAVIIIGLVAGVGIYTYVRKVGALQGWRRGTVIATRAVILILAMFLALNPQIVQDAPKAGEQIVALLFDDSQSMQVKDEQGQTRGERLLQSYTQNEQQLERELGDRYVLARYRVGASPQRTASVDSLSFQQKSSDLAASIATVADEWSQSSLAAIVLFSDGIQQPVSSPVTDDRTPVPVIAVGIDEANEWMDLAVESIQVQRPKFDKSPVRLTASITAQGYAENEVLVQVVESTRVVASQQLTVNSMDDRLPVTLEWLPTTEDWIQYTISVQPVSEGNLTLDSALDQAPQNNKKIFVVDNRPITYRILFISGRPNWEHTFIRRALQDDDRLRLTSLIQLSAAQRTFVFRGTRTQTVNPLFEGFGDDQEEFGRYDEPIFLRIGAERHELTDGFPSEPEELFEYDLVILGDIERDFFRTRQLDLIRRFVTERGGSFLMMGGPRSFVDGGFKGSPLEPLLPVVLLSQDQYDSRQYEPFQVEPTLEGELDGIFSLSVSQMRSKQTWNDMPPLFGITPFSIVRPGATVLARSQTEDSSPIFAMQRYGAGRSAILASGETWAWHMKAEPDESQFGRIWRQIIRTMVDDVQRPIQLETPEEETPILSSLDLRMNVRDPAFLPMMGAQVTIEATLPNDEIRELSYEESIREPGLYTIPMTPEQRGLYQIKATVAMDADETKTVESGFWVDEDNREWEILQADMAWMKSTAESTGGTFLSLNDIQRIPSLIPHSETAEREITRHPIMAWTGWFFIFLTLFSIEWILRRTRGLA